MRKAFQNPGAGLGPTPMAAMAPPPPAPPPPTTPDVPEALSAAELGRLVVCIENPVVVPTAVSLPSEASIVPVKEEHIPALRRLNALLLPVDYTASFYAGLLDPLTSGLFSRVILWTDNASRSTSAPKVVGGMVCRFETNPFVDEEGRPRAVDDIKRQAYPSSRSPYHAIYIQSLGILSPYRSAGLAAGALEQVIGSARTLRDQGPRYDARPGMPMINVQVVYAHVWTQNEEGLRWYESRGFVRDPEPIKDYYLKLQPGSAWIVRRWIEAV